MRIADAQIHVWTGGTPPHASGPAAPFGHRELLPRMDEAGVWRAVLVPPSWATGGNEAGLEAAAAHPDRFGVMGVLALDDPASRRTLTTWRSRRGMLGVRQVFNRPPFTTWLRDGSIEWFWETAEDRHIPVMAATPGALGDVGEVARRHPGLRVVFDHFGMSSDDRGRERDAHLRQLLDLAALPNVAVKASRLPLFSDEAYPFRDVHGLVHRVLDAFGPERVFWGSDLTWLRCPYSEAVGMMDEALAPYSEGTRTLVMGGALCAWLGWPGS